jgi:amidase
MRSPTSAALFTLVLSCAAPALLAETYRFTPKTFVTSLSSSHPPVLRIKSGDSVVAATTDARGQAGNGASMLAAPPAQTGPFFVEGAEPGDLLVVTLRRLEPIGQVGYSAGSMLAAAVPAGMLSRRPDTARYPWAIDRDRGLVRLDLQAAMPGVNWRARFGGAALELPLRPALGSIAVAPRGGEELATTATGEFGGNLSAAALEAGARVMLPVFHPGALLSFGQGLARTGDGTTAGTGVETPLEVEFGVEVVKRQDWPHSSLVRGSTVVGEFPMGAPRVESSTHLMAIGSGATLPHALRLATAELHHWLDDDFGLNERSVSVFLGQAIEYEIASVAEPSAVVVAKVRKAYLPAPSTAP